MRSLNKTHRCSCRSEYLDELAAEVDTILQERGFVTVNEICQRYNLPLDFTLSVRCDRDARMLASCGGWLPGNASSQFASRSIGMGRGPSSPIHMWRNLHAFFASSAGGFSHALRPSIFRSCPLLIHFRPSSLPSPVSRHILASSAGGCRHAWRQISPVFLSSSSLLGPFPCPPALGYRGQAGQAGARAAGCQRQVQAVHPGVPEEAEGQDQGRVDCSHKVCERARAEAFSSL